MWYWKNKLNITQPAELARVDEKLSKDKAVLLYETGYLEQFASGTLDSLFAIHRYLFEDIYPFAGQRREIEAINGNFRNVPMMYLGVTLLTIEKMPQSTFDEIVEKYVEMHIAHPFLIGNGRSMRIWLNQIFQEELGQVVDWRLIAKQDYLMAMDRSPIKDIEIKYYLHQALTDQVHDLDMYLEGIDQSYFYDGYDAYMVSE